ncbi:hypothetical protein BC828DRAFT_245850 [Blastocladiella britannica]|nr:hypothetical protein BC828DRAFT_245850 [Blastocladiella britannica]
MSLVNLAIFMVLMLAFSTMPGQGWVYSTIAFIRVYSCLSTVSILTVPILVQIYNGRGGVPSRSMAVSRATSADSLTEYVQHLRSSDGRNATPRPDLLPGMTTTATAVQLQQQQVGSVAGSTAFGVTGRGEKGSMMGKLTKNTKRHQQQSLEIMHTRSLPPLTPRQQQQPYADDSTVYQTSTMAAGQTVSNVAVGAAAKSAKWNGDGPAGHRGCASVRYQILAGTAAGSYLAAQPERPRAGRVPQTVGGGRVAGRFFLVCCTRCHIYCYRSWTWAYSTDPVDYDSPEPGSPHTPGLEACHSADRLAGPPTSFELILVEDRGQSATAVRRPSRAALMVVLHCVAKKQFLALQFPSQAQYQEFMALVPPRTALEAQPLMSVI